MIKTYSHFYYLKYLFFLESKNLFLSILIIISAVNLSEMAEELQASLVKFRV